MKEIGKLRTEIDSIDDKIIKLLSERIKVSKKIKKYKLKNGVKVYDRKREKMIFKKLEKDSIKNKIDPKYLKKVFKIIIKNSRMNQK